MNPINGITVLNSTEVFISCPGIDGFFFFLALVTIFFFGCTIYGISVKDESLFRRSALLTVFFFVLSLLIFSAGNSKASSYMTYDVIIDDSVSLTEFNEHYDIIQQKGLIYTIRECTTE